MLYNNNKVYPASFQNNFKSGGRIISVRNHQHHALPTLTATSGGVEFAGVSLAPKTHIVDGYCPPDITEGVDIENIRMQIHNSDESHDYYFCGDLHADHKSARRMAQLRWKLIGQLEKAAPRNFLFPGTGEYMQMRRHILCPGLHICLGARGCA